MPTRFEVLPPGGEGGRNFSVLPAAREGPMKSVLLPVLCIILLAVAGCSNRSERAEHEERMKLLDEQHRLLREQGLAREEQNRKDGIVITLATFGWILQENTNKMDGTKTLMLRHAAENESDKKLVITCAENKTKVYVAVASQVESTEYRSPVRLKFDDGPAIKERWGVSDGGEALFAPNGMALLRRLSRSKQFLFEYTPFRMSDRVIAFHLVGLNEQLPKIASACGGPPDQETARKKPDRPVTGWAR